MATENPPADYEWLAALEEPDAYPEECAKADLRRIDTHISHVFLTARRAYKLRRPVRLAFLDFSSREERTADCLREVALNRRLAPDVYLGVAPILRENGRVRIGPPAESPSLDPYAVEHCVVMRRLQEGRDLRRMLAAGLAGPRHLDRIAETIAEFHRDHGLGRPAPCRSDAWIALVAGPARANFDALAGADPALAPPGEVAEIRAAAEAFLAGRSEDFERRRRDGRLVDGHGDLHCEHAWFETDDADPLLVDCLEFRDDFRRIDAASDVAFLAMDLDYLGHPELSARFLRRYARAGGDYHLFSVVDYFLSYRALVRAKVASLVAGDASIGDAQRRHAAASTRRHLDLGLAYLASRPIGALVLTCGTIGSGKTTVAEALADRTGAVVLSSDRVRDKSASAGGRAGYGSGDYGIEARTAVYDALLEAADAVVRSGRVAILDATFARRAWRTLAAKWAASRGCATEMVHVVAGDADVRARLTERRARGDDASEAGPELLAAMNSEFETPDEWPAEALTAVDTGCDGWERELDLLSRRLARQSATAPRRREPPSE